MVLLLDRAPHNCEQKAHPAGHSMNQFSLSVGSQDQIVPDHFAVISAHTLKILRCACPAASLAVHNCTGKDDNSKVRRNIFEF